MMHLSLAFATSLVLPLSALAGMMRGDATPSLTLHLFAPRTVQKADDFVVSATVVNTGSRDVTLLKHGMMRQKLDNFAVVDASGTPIKFTGIKVGRHLYCVVDGLLARFLDLLSCYRSSTRRSVLPRRALRRSSSHRGRT